MALNPPLTPQGTPFRLENEYLLIERRGIEIELVCQGMSKLSAKGVIYLTTARLLFVNKNFERDSFKAVDIPVANMSGTDFKQPIFGSNYLSFTLKPLFNFLPAPAAVKLWFTEGGCDKFLRIFEHVSKQVYEQKKAGRMNDTLIKNWENGYFSQKAFYDPSDPTVVFTQQPPVFSSSNQFIGTNIYNQGNNQQNNHLQSNYPQSNYPQSNYPQSNYPQPTPPKTPDQRLPPNSQAPANDYKVGGHSSDHSEDYPVLEESTEQTPNPQNPSQPTVIGTNNPQGQHVNPPGMYNPHYAMQNNNANADYYFGFFGPKLDRT